MNKYEIACKEWLKGCSCTDAGKQEQCKECTLVFLNYIKTLQIGVSDEVDQENVDS